MNGPITLDLSGLQTKEQFHRLVRETFSFPLHYGENKDAFWDCLNDFASDVTVVVKGETTLPPEMKSFVDGYLEILAEFQSESSGAFKVQKNQIPAI